MNRITDYIELRDRIVGFLEQYRRDSGMESFVVGVSGGIDSAVASTLAATTGAPVYALGMPIHQKPEQENLSDEHLHWLQLNFPNVTVLKYNLTDVFETFKTTMGEESVGDLPLANTRSRLRMVTLYQVAGLKRGLVVGTGNKVEDYGVGFYTKYGDGGVDIAPIADLYKTEVWQLGVELGVNPRIVQAPPTDGLWDDGRTDEDQLGATYEDLEWVMDSKVFEHCNDPTELTQWMGNELTLEQRAAIRQYEKFNTQNKHKMEAIPTFKL